MSGPHSSSTFDCVQEYIEHSRHCLGLETVPSQHPTEAGMIADPMETLLASSGPITGVRYLKTLSRQRVKASSPATSGVSVEFVYALLRQNKKGCAVYDMYIASADKARVQKQYYTISAFNVSEVTVFTINTVFTKL